VLRVALPTNLAITVGELETLELLLGRAVTRIAKCLR
jgi:hypothetical protein